MNLKSLFKNITQIIKKSNALTFILVMALYSFGAFIVILPLVLYVDKYDPNEGIGKEYSKLEFFLLVALFAPLIETFVYQYLVIELLKKVKKFIPLNDLCIVLISAFLFGLAHASSYSYALANFIGGIVLAHTYLIAVSKKLSPFMCTASVHSIRNSIVFLISLMVLE